MSAVDFPRIYTASETFRRAFSPVRNPSPTACKRREWSTTLQFILTERHSQFGITCAGCKVSSVAFVFHNHTGTCTFDTGSGSLHRSSRSLLLRPSCHLYTLLPQSMGGQPRSVARGVAITVHFFLGQLWSDFDTVHINGASRARSNIQ
jgi:hypothetical protein